MMICSICSPAQDASASMSNTNKNEDMIRDNLHALFYYDLIMRMLVSVLCILSLSASYAALLAQ